MVDPRNDPYHRLSSNRCRLTVSIVCFKEGGIVSGSFPVDDWTRIHCALCLKGLSDLDLRNQ